MLSKKKWTFRYLYVLFKRVFRFDVFWRQQKRMMKKFSCWIFVYVFWHLKLFEKKKKDLHILFNLFIIKIFRKIYPWTWKLFLTNKSAVWGWVRVEWKGEVGGWRSWILEIKAGFVTFATVFDFFLKNKNIKYRKKRIKFWKYSKTSLLFFYFPECTQILLKKTVWKISLMTQ